MTRLNRPMLQAYLEERTFSAPGVGAPNSRRIGAEVELIPIDAATGRPCPLDDGAGPATLRPGFPGLPLTVTAPGWKRYRGQMSSVPPARSMRVGAVASA